MYMFAYNDFGSTSHVYHFRQYRSCKFYSTLLQVRAFADWPGTRAKFQVIDMNGNANDLEIKIITTRVSDASDMRGSGNEISFAHSALLVPCAGHSWLEVLFTGTLHT